MSEHLEAAVIFQVTAINRNGGTTIVLIQTAIENRDDQYLTIGSHSYAVDPALPDAQYFYFAGTSSGPSTAPGFARYLRIRVDQAAGASISISAKAVLKP